MSADTFPFVQARLGCETALDNNPSRKYCRLSRSRPAGRSA